MVQDLGTFGGNAMWIREGMRRPSTLTIDRAVTGARVSIPGAATGREYLAFCRDNGYEFLGQS
jgi:IclR family transcriptional regulator, mhp operon transcriptional activator